MANSLSAKKRIRRNARKAKVNRERRSRIRSAIKRVELAIAEGNVKSAEEALVKAQPEIDRGVAKGIMHKNKAARKLSRLSGHIKDLKKAS